MVLVRIFVIGMLLFICKGCATSFTKSVVVYHPKSQVYRLKVPLPENHKVEYFGGPSTELLMLILNEDSVGIYVANDFWFPNANKLDTLFDRPAMFLEKDTVIFSGKDNVGNWKHIETSQVCYGYFGITDERTVAFDSLLLNIRAKRVGRFGNLLFSSSGK